MLLISISSDVEKQFKWLHWSQVARAAEAFPYFCSMKRLGVLLLPPEWDASLVLILLLLLPLKYYYYSRA